jgi:hypothetical protein
VGSPRFPQWGQLQSALGISRPHSEHVRRLMMARTSVVQPRPDASRRPAEAAPSIYCRY